MPNRNVPPRRPAEDGRWDDRSGSYPRQRDYEDGYGRDGYGERTGHADRGGSDRAGFGERAGYGDTSYGDQSYRHQYGPYGDGRAREGQQHRAGARPAAARSGSARRASRRRAVATGTTTRPVPRPDYEGRISRRSPSRARRPGRRRRRGGRWRRARADPAGPRHRQRPLRRRRPGRRDRRPAQRGDLRHPGRAAAEHGAHLHRAERELHGLARRQRAAQEHAQDRPALLQPERGGRRHQGHRQDGAGQGPDPPPGEPDHLRHQHQDDGRHQADGHRPVAALAAGAGQDRADPGRAEARRARHVQPHDQAAARAARGAQPEGRPRRPGGHPDHDRPPDLVRPPALRGDGRLLERLPARRGVLRRRRDDPGLVRPRRDPQARAGQLRRHARGGQPAPGPAGLPEPEPVHEGPGQREPRPREPRALLGRRRRRLHRAGRQAGRAAADRPRRPRRRVRLPSRGALRRPGEDHGLQAREQLRRGRRGGRRGVLPLPGAAQVDGPLHRDQPGHPVRLRHAAQDARRPAREVVHDQQGPDQAGADDAVQLRRSSGPRSARRSAGRWST